MMLLLIIIAAINCAILGVCQRDPMTRTRYRIAVVSTAAMCVFSLAALAANYYVASILEPREVDLFLVNIGSSALCLGLVFFGWKPGPLTSLK